jgi:hypothetical protein
MFYPDKRGCRGQQHDVTRLDQSLHRPGMPVLKTAKRESLEAQVGGLFIANMLADAPEQVRARGVTQSGVVGSSQQFRRHQNLETQFQTCQPANPSESAMHPVRPQATRVFYLEESGKHPAVALLFPQEKLQRGDQPQVSRRPGETLRTLQHPGSASAFAKLKLLYGGNDGQSFRSR